ncbi:MAG: trehalose-phosphatase [Anaerolineae bacterium]
MNWQQAADTLLRTLVDQPRLGLITDVDGTISPIVAQPDAARVTPRCRELLAALVPHLTLTAAISGRAAQDVQARVGVDGMIYLGNHGMERWAGDHTVIDPEVATYRPALEAAVRDLEREALPGMLIEDKHATITAHYRRTDDPEEAARTFRPIAQRIAAAHGLHCYEGRMIFDLRPPVALNKGTALRAMVHRCWLDGALYLGDDITDVDAMQAARELRETGACFALSVGVSAAETPPAVYESADLLAEGVGDVELLLRWLLEARIAARPSST